LGLWSRNIDHPQVSAGPGLTKGYSGTLPTWTVFTRSAEDVLYFILAHSMVIDMRLSYLRIKIEANIHALHPSDSNEYQRPNGTHEAQVAGASARLPLVALDAIVGAFRFPSLLR
jgi:hypothetical protein